MTGHLVNLLRSLANRPMATRAPRAAWSVVAAVVVLTGCRFAPDERAGPPLAVVLSGAPGQIHKLHELTATGISRTAVRLSQPGASAAAMDAQGRVWVGGRSVHGLPMTSISVISADLAQQTRVTTTENPGVGIVFARGKAYVAATNSGFGGSVTQIDPATLATRNATIPPPHGPSYILTSIAANDNQIVVAGMVAGPDPRKRYAALTVIDAEALDIIWQSPPLENTDIWQILPHGDRFVLLNVASADDRTPNRADLLQLGPDHRLMPLALSGLTAASPLWGHLQGDILYAYHNPTWNSVFDSPERALSITNLRTQQSKTVKLPEGMDASDLRVAGQHILLSVKSSTPQHPGGVYTLDLQGEHLRLLASLPDAGKLAGH